MSERSAKCRLFFWGGENVKIGAVRAVGAIGAIRNELC